jgi:hypothetical protein
MRILTKPLCTAALVLAAVACGDGTGPTLTDGDIFVLRSIAGVVVPAPWAPNPGATERMLSAALTLHEDGTGTWVAVVETAVSGPTVAWNNDVTWVRSGDHLEIDIECDDLGSCIPGPHLVGDLTETGFTVTESSVTRSPLIFERATLEAGPA